MTDKIEQVKQILGNYLLAFEIAPIAKQIDALYTERAGEANLCNTCMGRERCRLRTSYNLTSCENYRVDKSQPVPPVEPDLMLTAHAINVAKKNALLGQIADKGNLLDEAIAKAQLKACQDYYQPLLTANEAKIKELEESNKFLRFELRQAEDTEAIYFSEIQQLKSEGKGK